MDGCQNIKQTIWARCVCGSAANMHAARHCQRGGCGRWRSVGQGKGSRQDFHIPGNFRPTFSARAGPEKKSRAAAMAGLIKRLMENFSFQFFFPFVVAPFQSRYPDHRFRPAPENRGAPGGFHNSGTPAPVPDISILPSETAPGTGGGETEPGQTPAWRAKRFC